ncbi:MAG: N-acetyltransferase family protein [Actinomycetes bacterium]
MADVSVRLANVQDATGIAAVQAASWKAALSGTLPPAVLDQLQGAEAVEQWRRAVLDPPTPRHRLLVALAGSDVVGFAAIGPAGDPDSDAATDAELLAVGVLPDRAREGHGSRLVNASVDHLREDGFTRAHVWLPDTDQALREFLEAAGWADDGARRRLDLRGDGDVVVDQLRLDASISETA